MQSHSSENPLRSVNDWDDDVQQRYRQDRKTEEFRDYDSAPQSVRDFYKLNHTRQTLDFVLLPGLVEFHATLDTLSLADADLLIEATNATPLSGAPSAPACGLGAELTLLGLLSRRLGRAASIYVPGSRERTWDRA